MVNGPAFAFDADAINAIASLIRAGYCHGLLAGNALATHDLEGALLKTALGQDIYTQQSVPNGHYNHLDICNRVRRCGSIPAFVKEYDLHDGILCACVEQEVPYVLTAHLGDIPGASPEKTKKWFQYIQPFTPPIWKNAARVIAVSEFSRTMALKSYNVPIDVIPNGRS